MPRISLYSVIATLPLLVGGTTLAHEGHDEDQQLTGEQVASLGDKTLPAVIKSKKLAASWQKAQRQKTALRNAGGGQVWVVSYLNAQEPDAKNRTLYVFFDELGNFVAANQSGELPEG